MVLLTKLITRSSNIPKRFYSAAKMEFFDGKSGDKLDKDGFFNRVLDFRAKCEKAQKKSVILIGENHDDSASRMIQLKVLKSFQTSPSIAFSLEFYERDIQPVLDEYLDGVIDYDTFLGDSRPPSNHAEYKPLIDFCKESKIPVVAANCPRRYTRVVGRQGRNALESLVTKNSDFYRIALPPLPYQEASEQYRQEFLNIMGIVSSNASNQDRMARMLDAQSLWDASMAHSVAKALEKKDLVVHVCGYFHCQKFLGIGEHLQNYLDTDQYETLTVVVYPEDVLEFKPDDHGDLGDLVVLTDISKLV